MSGVRTLTHPDLVPVMVQGPPDGVAESNSHIEVRWQVLNDGTAATLGGWTDTVWLSRDGVVSNDDIKLGELLAEAALAAGGVYDGVLTGTLPISPDGEYRLIVKSASGAVVAETAAGEANNKAALLSHVGLADSADLDISHFKAPPHTHHQP